MSTLYLRTFFVAILTVYLVQVIKHLNDTPELKAADTFVSLMLFLAVTAAGAGIVYFKNRFVDVALTVGVVLGFLYFTTIVSTYTLWLGLIGVGWLVLLGLILFAHQITKHWNAGAKSWNEINQPQEAPQTGGLEVILGEDSSSPVA